MPKEFDNEDANVIEIDHSAIVAQLVAGRPKLRRAHRLGQDWADRWDHEGVDLGGEG